MRIVVFLGPTLPVRIARSLINATFLPPAAHGDLFRAALAKPDAIALIDGYFESSPAVRHKEILWAMSEGIHVFGAASMGALRAAELAPFGMIGVGDVFCAYKNNLIEDDDEVAIKHGPLELEYVALTEAMINIRATLRSAEHSGIIDSSLHDDLLRLAKQTYYAYRTYTSLIESGRRENLNDVALDRFANWIPNGRVDLKAQDAMKLFTTLSDFAGRSQPRFKAAYAFTRTEAWDRDVAAATPTALDELDILREDVLQEVRLVPGLYNRFQDAGLARGLALREADRQGIELDEKAQKSAVADWLRGQGLDAAALVAWQEENLIQGRQFESFVLEEARRSRLRDIAEPLIERNLLAALRSAGDFARFVDRARAKRKLLGDHSSERVDPMATADQLTRWYVVGRPGISQNISPETLACELGFSDVRSFQVTLWREFLYNKKIGKIDEKTSLPERTNLA